jgi:hypothetical protein
VPPPLSCVGRCSPQPCARGPEQLRSILGPAASCAPRSTLSFQARRRRRRPSYCHILRPIRLVCCSLASNGRGGTWAGICLRLWRSYGANTWRLDTSYVLQRAWQNGNGVAAASTHSTLPQLFVVQSRGSSSQHCTCARLGWSVCLINLFFVR